MSEEQMREKFEAAVSEHQAANGFDPVCFHRADDGEYVDSHLNAAWWGWQACRAALVVTLPLGASLSERTTGFEEPGDPALIQRSLAMRAIEAAGVRVKP